MTTILYYTWIVLSFTVIWCVALWYLFSLGRDFVKIIPTTTTTLVNVGLFADDIAPGDMITIRSADGTIQESKYGITDVKGDVLTLDIDAVSELTGADYSVVELEFKNKGIIWP